MTCLAHPLKGVNKIYEPLLSHARLSTYRKASQSEEEAVARYFWNLKLAGALLPTLALTEIILRNRIVHAFDRTNSQWLNATWEGWSDYKYRPKAGSDYIRGNPEREILLSARQKWGSHRDAMIADLPLGFWTGLFKAHYKNQIWFKRGVIKDVFPDLTIKVPDIVSEMSRRLARFRHLRNRVCHHEPIFNWPGGQQVNYVNLAAAHAETMELLGWLSTQACKDLKQIDTFIHVWQDGL